MNGYIDVCCDAPAALSAYVHHTPDETELAAIRRNSETGLPGCKLHFVGAVYGPFRRRRY